MAERYWWECTGGRQGGTLVGTIVVFVRMKEKLEALDNGKFGYWIIMLGRMKIEPLLSSCNCYWRDEERMMREFLTL